MLAPLDPYALYSALLGARAYAARFAEHGRHDLPVPPGLADDLIALIDRVLGPAAPIPTHRDTPALQARRDALAEPLVRSRLAPQAQAAE